MTTQTKINFALGVTCLALSAINIGQYNALEGKASTTTIESLSDSIIQLDLNYNELLTASKDMSKQAEISPELIASVLMEQPEVIVKSLAKYRFEQEQVAQKQEAEQIKNSMAALYTDKNDPFFGNPNGKNQLVQFVDYNCGYCKKLASTLDQLIEIDPEAKVIVKEYPIFTDNPTSAYSSMIATAVFYYKPEMYADVHNALMATPRLSRSNIDSTIAKLGISKEALQPYMQKAKDQIESVRLLGGSLKVTGTPTVFIGGERTHGGWTAEQFKAQFQ